MFDIRLRVMLAVNGPSYTVTFSRSLLICYRV
jgi:hypothetical protein